MKKKGKGRNEPQDLRIIDLLQCDVHRFDHDPRLMTAIQILQKHYGQSMEVMKVTRAGFTSSIIMAAIYFGFRVCIVEPTNNICKKTVNEALVLFDQKQLTKTPKKHIHFGANADICYYAKKAVKDALENDIDLQLKFPFIPKEDCSNCTRDCVVNQILHASTDIYSLTYAKLSVLLLYSELKYKEGAENTLKKIYDILLNTVDIWIFDESNNITTLSENPIIVYDEEGKFRLDDVYSTENLSFDFKGQRVFKVWTEFVEFIAFMTDRKIDTEFLNPYPDLKHNGIYLYNKLFEMANKGMDIGNIPKILLEFMNEEFVYVYNEQTRQKEFYACYTHEKTALKKLYYEIRKRNKTVICSDAAVSETPLEDFFNDTFQTESYGEMGDLLYTEEQQLLIADTKNVGVRSFRKNRRIRKDIKVYLQRLCETFGTKSIIIIAQNKQINKEIGRWIGKKELPRIKHTYFRSDILEGVGLPPEKKVMVCIGLPYSPMVHYKIDNLLYGTKPGETIIKRKTENANRFIETIGRHKDPNGKERSLVLCYGARHYEIKKFLLPHRGKRGYDNLAKPYLIDMPQTGVFDTLSLELGRAWMDGKTIEEVVEIENMHDYNKKRNSIELKRKIDRELKRRKRKNKNLK